MRSPCIAMKSSPHPLQLEKAHAQQRRPNAAKKKNNRKTPKNKGPTSDPVVNVTKAYSFDMGPPL